MNRPVGYSPENVNVPALIMGNGPSLGSVDFGELEGFATFGMNAAYRYWEKIGWWPDYYSCLDVVVGESHKTAIAGLISRSEGIGIRQFLLRHRLIKRLGRLGRSPLVSCYEELLADNILPKLQDVTTGSHTLLWAETLGYTTLLLAGVDCNYQELVPGASKRGDHLEIITESPNPNYFFDGYQQPGDRYNVPNASPDMHVRSWRNAARHLSPGTCVVNLNPDSRMDVFPVNTDAPSFLTPGSIRTVATVDTTRDHSHDLTALRETLADCSRYQGAVSTERIAQFIEDLLDPSRVELVMRWRPPSAHPIQLATAREDAEPNSAYQVEILSLGDLSLESTELPVHGAETTKRIVLVLNEPNQLLTLAQLVRGLHEDLGAPPLGIRIRRRLVHWISWCVRRVIPWRLRAMGRGSLRRRLAFPRNRMEKPYSGDKTLQ